MMRWLVVLCLSLVSVTVSAQTGPVHEAECPNIDTLAALTPQEPAGDPDVPVPGLPGDALRASCTGVQCGCDTDLNECLALCPTPQGTCGIQCRRDYDRCSFCCCATEPTPRCQ